MPPFLCEARTGFSRRGGVARSEEAPRVLEMPPAAAAGGGGKVGGRGLGDGAGFESGGGEWTRVEVGKAGAAPPLTGIPACKKKYFVASYNYGECSYISHIQ